MPHILSVIFSVSLLHVMLSSQSSSLVSTGWKGAPRTATAATDGATTSARRVSCHTGSTSAAMWNSIASHRSNAQRWMMLQHLLMETLRTSQVCTAIFPSLAVLHNTGASLNAVSQISSLCLHATFDNNSHLIINMIWSSVEFCCGPIDLFLYACSETLLITTNFFKFLHNYNFHLRLERPFSSILRKIAIHCIMFPTIELLGRLLVRCIDLVTSNLHC